MEHLDVCIPDFKVKFAFSNEIEAVHCMLMYGRSLSNFCMKTIRLRGGTGSEPNTDSKFNEIPYLSKMNFMWNGLPCLDFDEKYLYYIYNRRLMATNTSFPYDMHFLSKLKDEVYAMNVHNNEVLLQYKNLDIELIKI